MGRFERRKSERADGRTGHHNNIVPPKKTEAECQDKVRVRFRPTFQPNVLFWLISVSFTIFCRGTPYEIAYASSDCLALRKFHHHSRARCQFEEASFAVTSPHWLQYSLNEYDQRGLIPLNVPNHALEERPEREKDGGGCLARFWLETLISINAKPAFVGNHENPSIHFSYQSSCHRSSFQIPSGPLLSSLPLRLHLVMLILFAIGFAIWVNWC